MKIAIVGAGHAGVEAALAVRQDGGEAVLFSNEMTPPYFRPRLPSVAFGQTAAASIAIHPVSWYAEKGIELRLDAAVTAIVAAELAVVSRAGHESFDAIVLATGARPLLPRIEGLQAPGLPVFVLWSQQDAARLLAQVGPKRRLAIVGGGILGLEAALRAREAGLSVTLIERLPRLMPLQFGEKGSETIRATLSAIGIDVRVSACLTSIRQQGETAVLALSDQQPVVADFVLIAIGAAPHASLAVAAGLATDRGVLVDEWLQTRAPRIFAAGDLAQYGKALRCSVRSAAVQGRLAGANAVAAVSGALLQKHLNQEYPVFFKSRELELYAIGRSAYERLTELRLDDGCNPARFQAVVKDGETLIGAQMVGTREGFDALVETIRAAVI